MAGAKGGKAKGGKGRGGHRGGRGGGGMNLVQSAIAPIQQQIAAERAANLQRAQAQMGFAKAAAAIMQNAAPRVSDNYTNAANADAGYARGLGDVAQQPVDQNAQANNAFLQKMGTPQGALQQAAPVGDISYGLQGYIPATTLQREGAAWGSAAQLLPGNLLKAGQQQAGATLANDPALTKLQGDLGTAASEAAYRQATLKSENAYRNAELNLREQSLQSENAYRGAELKLSAARLNLAAQQSVQRNRQEWARIGLSRKSLALRAAKSELKSRNGGGLTPNEIHTWMGKAGAIAQATFNGVPATSTKPALPPLSFKKAMQKEILAGVPPSIALKALKEAGYKVPSEKVPIDFAGIPNPGGGGFFGAPGKAAFESAAAHKIVQLAHEYMGTPYKWGGESPSGFDCSGFAQFLYAKAGIRISRTTYTQWKEGRPVGKGQLQPGDLVFFRGSDSVGGLPGHVGIYIGGGKMIDAPHTGATVRIDNVGSFGGYMGARRYGRG